MCGILCVRPFYWYGLRRPYNDLVYGCILESVGVCVINLFQLKYVHTVTLTQQSKEVHYKISG